MRVQIQMQKGWLQVGLRQWARPQDCPRMSSPACWLEACLTEGIDRQPDSKSNRTVQRASRHVFARHMNKVCCSWRNSINLHRPAPDCETEWSCTTLLSDPAPPMTLQHDLLIDRPGDRVRFLEYTPCRPARSVKSPTTPSRLRIAAPVNLQTDK